MLVNLALMVRPMQDFDFYHLELENEMPLNDTDKGWIRNEIQITHKRQGLGKLSGFFKDWSGFGAAIAILIFIFTQWGNYVEFRTRTSDRLDGLERDVHSLQRSQVNVSLKSAIDEAKAGQRDNANSHIQQATDILQNLSEDHAPAPNSFFESAINTLNQLRSTTIGEAAVHQASVRLAEYRSTLNPAPPLPKRPGEAPNNSTIVAFRFTPTLYTFSNSVIIPPKPLTLNGYGAALDGRPLPPNKEFLIPSTRSLDENPFIVKGVILVAGTQSLDYITWQDVTFVNTHIKYGDGPAKLLNVRFVNCSFDLPVNDFGAQVAEYAALEPKQEVKVG